MTIKHAQAYLDKLRAESRASVHYTRSNVSMPSIMLRAYAGRFPTLPPHDDGTILQCAEWFRFYVRTYDEAQRLRAIAEGREPPQTAEERVAELERALAGAVEWMAEDGCDCGVMPDDECCVCKARRVLQRSQKR